MMMIVNHSKDHRQTCVIKIKACYCNLIKLFTYFAYCDVFFDRWCSKLNPIISFIGCFSIVVFQSFYNILLNKLSNV